MKKSVKKEFIKLFGPAQPTRFMPNAIFVLIMCNFIINPMRNALSTEIINDNHYTWPNLPTSDEIISEDTYSATPGITFRDFEVYKGNIFKIPAFGALFFKDKNDLLTFERSGHIDSSAIIFHPYHVVRAQEHVKRKAGGGIVFDELYGDGYVIFSRSNDLYYKYKNIFSDKIDFSHKYFQRHARSSVNNALKLNNKNYIPLRLKNEF